VRVLVLGKTGMLGYQTIEYLSKYSAIEVFATGRQKNADIFLDVVSGDIRTAIQECKPNFIINCVGVIKNQINLRNLNSVEEAINVNSLFPWKLAEHAEKTGIPTIQIATDCVFNGKSGNYSESSTHDAEDIYGKTKSLGEAQSQFVMHLRTSIIGRERFHKRSLVEWFMSRERNATIDGYKNHLWNGITTLAFARIVRGIIEKGNFKPGVHHVVPADIISKYDLLCLFQKKFNRNDININPTNARDSINRTLCTIDILGNDKFWTDAEFGTVPKILQLIEEF
jgi:dTDP-4-dehydrorhamnose reductase